MGVTNHLRINYHPVESTLETNDFKVALLHLGISDILKMRSSTYIEKLVLDMKMIINKCKSFGVQKFIILYYLEAPYSIYSPRKVVTKRISKLGKMISRFKVSGSTSIKKSLYSANTIRQ